MCQSHDDDVLLILLRDVNISIPTQNAKGEHLMTLPELLKALSLTQEMNDAWFDLIKDFKASGRPTHAKLRPMDVPES
ncbi:hypothetical protein ACHAW6_013344 [Cyclotella cf. meneghiniana]